MKRLAKKNSEPKVPKTSTAEMFATRMVFSRKMRSGIIGEATLASMTTKAVSSATTPTSEPMVRKVSQPTVVASPSVKISSSRPAVRVTAPRVSNLPRSSALLSGRMRGASTAAPRPIGTLIQKIHSQPQVSASTPPRITPTMDAIPDSEPHTPSALLRSGPSAKVLVRIARAAGVISAAPKPWTAREAMSIVPFSARPEVSDASAKITKPIWISRRRPKVSASRPPSSRKPPRTVA